MAHIQLQTTDRRDSGGRPAHRPPSGWAELIVALVQEYPVRIAAAIVIGILGLTLDVSCEEDYVPAPEGSIAAAQARRLGVAAPEIPAEPAPPRVEPNSLRFELGELPGTGHAGVTRLLSKYGVSRDEPEAEREFAAHVRTALGGADPGERLGAVRVLARLGPAAGAEDLIVLSRDPEDEIRFTALRGLGRMQGAGVDPALARLREVVADSSAARDERFQAMQSLSRIRIRVDVEFVAGVAERERDPLLLLIAARTLLSYRDERAVPLLVSLLGAEAVEGCTAAELSFVRRQANEALRDVTPAQPPSETEAGWRAVAPRIIGALGADGFEYVPSTLYPPR